MKKCNFFRNLAVSFILLVLLVSCAGKFPAPDSEEDTLLIVLTEMNIEGEAGEALTYFEITTNQSDRTIYITPNKPICITTNLPPGEYLAMSIIEKDYNSKYFEREGDPQEEPVEIEVPFELKAGYISFFPVKFIYTVKQSAGEEEGLQYRWDLELVTELDKFSALDILKEEEDFPLWKNDFGL